MNIFLGALILEADINKLKFALKIIKIWHKNIDKTKFTFMKYRENIQGVSRALVWCCLCHFFGEKWHRNGIFHGEGYGLHFGNIWKFGKWGSTS